METIIVIISIIFKNMELKTKSIKRTLLIFGGVILICFTTLMLHSCSNEDSSIKANTTEVDKTSALISNSEFISMKETAKDYGNDIRSNYLKLSEADQKLFTSTLEQVKTAESATEVRRLMDSASSIIKIDIFSQLEVLSTKSTKLLNNGDFEGVDKRALLAAINKGSSIKGETTRFKVTAEGILTPKEACLAGYVVGLAGCTVTGPAYAVCAGVCYAAYLICLDQCK